MLLLFSQLAATSWLHIYQSG